MRRRATFTALLACLVLGVPAALAATGVFSYQGWTAQGQQISFRVTKQGVSRMKLTVLTQCSGGDKVAFTLKATDTKADPIRKATFTTVLKSAGAPTATVKATFNKYFVGRGTITAKGRGRGPDGASLGTCATKSSVRWTAGP